MYINGTFVEFIDDFLLLTVLRVYYLDDLLSYFENELDREILHVKRN
jgi:hypothetical protein